jgi:hypothetical protein
MISRILFSIVFVLVFISCEKPCDEASTGPPSFLVEIVDSATNENVFTNGTYTEGQLSVTTSPATISFSYGFFSEDNRNLIRITPSWSEGMFITTIKLGNQIAIPIESIITKSESRCNTNYFIQSLTLEGFEYEIEVETGIYKIKIN